MLGKSGDIFVITTGRVLLHFIRDALNHPAMHRPLPAPPPIMIYSTQASAVPSLRSCSREREDPYLGAVGDDTALSFPPSSSFFFFYHHLPLVHVDSCASLLPWNAWDPGAKISQSYVLESVVELGQSELNPRVMLSVGVALGANYLIFLSLN